MFLQGLGGQINFALVEHENYTPVEREIVKIYTKRNTQALKSVGNMVKSNQTESRGNMAKLPRQHIWSYFHPELQPLPFMHFSILFCLNIGDKIPI